jgi:hypothetical protein
MHDGSRVARSFERAGEGEIDDRVGPLGAEQRCADAERAEPAVSIECERALEAGAQRDAVEAAVPARAEIGAAEDGLGGATARRRRSPR